MTRRERGERGQALVEFALILPVFLLLVLGGIDIGGTLLGDQSFQNATGTAAQAWLADQIDGDPVQTDYPPDSACVNWATQFQQAETTPPSEAVIADTANSVCSLARAVQDSDSTTVGLDSTWDSVKVGIVCLSNATTGTPCPSDPGFSGPVPPFVKICVTLNMHSLSGITGTILNGRAVGASYSEALVTTTTTTTTTTRPSPPTTAGGPTGSGAAPAWDLYSFSPFTCVAGVSPPTTTTAP